MTINIQPNKELIMEGPSFLMLKSKLEIHAKQNPNNKPNLPYVENGYWKCKVIEYSTPQILAEA